MQRTRSPAKCNEAPRLISRSAAKTQGLPTYFTGEPCSRGHVERRYVVNSACFGCARIRAREHYAKAVLLDRDRIRAQRRAWRQKPENLERRNAQAREWAKQNPGRKLVYERQRKGLPEPTRACPAVCESCNRPPGRHSLSLDHDHKTGRFRGWLCSNCNTAAGLLDDSPVFIRNLSNYLRRK